MTMKILKLAKVLSVTAAMMLTLPTVTKADETLERRTSGLFESTRTLSSFTKQQLEDNSNRQIMIKAKVGKETLEREFGVRVVSTSELLSKKGIYIANVPLSKDYQQVLNKLKNSPNVITAEPNFKQERQGITNPNDEYYPKLWHHQTIGTPAIWTYLEPKNEVVVAVLDTGVDYNHPDLVGQLLSGTDIYDNDSDPMDTNGHGTAIAGTIAAKVNNEIGVVGVNPYAKILPVRLGDENIYASDSVEGIYYAIEQGADVINLSYGASTPSKLEFEAVYEAYRNGILVVGASGNDKTKVAYPAAYPYVLSVGSSNIDEKVSDFSNFGETLDLVAPGELIGTTGLNGEYVAADGTSFSAPVVAGITSLMLMVEPELNPIAIEYLLEKAAKKYTSSQWGKSSGYGRVDAMNTFMTDFPEIKSDVGNLRNKAKLISLNKTYKDKFNLPADSDWYVLKVKKNAKIKVEVSGVANIDSSIWIDKYANGKVLTEKLYNKGKIGSKETFTYSLTPGTYYFEIYEQNNHWSEQSYSLKVSTIK